jgi:hypothetical protein
VVDLLQLAAAVLIQLAVAREDVQLLSSAIDWPGRISGSRSTGLVVWRFALAYLLHRSMLLNRFEYFVRRHA